MNFQPSPPHVSDAYARQQSSVALFFRDVYAWMAGGVALSGLVAFYVANSEVMLRAIFGNSLVFFAIAFAPLGVGLYFQRNAQQMTTFAAGNLFFAYAALMGALLSSALLVYSGASVVRAFFITSGTFGAAAAYGTVTKRELSQASQFLMMGLWGILIASVVNIFLRSSALDWVTSMAMVVVFTGLTAYDHQTLRRLHAYGGGNNLALMGAFSLYLNFINLFMAMLRIFGQRRDD